MSDYERLLEQDCHRMMAQRDALRVEVARLTAENERLRKVGFRLAERMSWCGNLGDRPLIKEWQDLTGTDVYKDEDGGAK